MLDVGCTDAEGVACTATEGVGCTDAEGVGCTALLVSGAHVQMLKVSGVRLLVGVGCSDAEGVGCTYSYCWCRV